MGFGYKLKSQVSKELCPYCFEYFSLKGTPFRCANHACANEADSVYEAHWGRKPVKRVIEAKGDFFEGLKNSKSCDKCNTITYNRICSHCHETLPPTTGEYKNHIYAVIGGPDSGKTHYIAVLINLLQNELGPKMDFMLDALGDETRIKYDRDFYKPLFEKHEVIRKTVSATANKSVQKPLIYGISILKNNKVKSYLTLVFFDTAGEDLNSEDTMAIVNKYIYRSDGIIMLVDPLQIVGVRNKLPNVAKPKTISSKSLDILSRTTQLIQKGLSLTPTDKINIPLAVSFTKMDAVEDLLEGDYQLKHKSSHHKGLNLDDIEAVSSEMKALLDKWGEGALTQMAEARYKDNKFFGLSALGMNPHVTQKVDKIIPNRIEDPFLWLLYKSGILKAKG
jgi:hypothetical protein